MKQTLLENKNLLMIKPRMNIQQQIPRPIFDARLRINVNITFTKINIAFKYLLMFHDIVNAQQEQLNLAPYK